MNASVERNKAKKGGRLSELLLVMGVVAMLAYAVTYLFALSPLMIRALGSLVAGS